MKHILLITLGVMFALGQLHAQNKTWQPSSGHVQVPIWPGQIPDAAPAPGPETATLSTGLVAGRPVTIIANVTEPTMTVYRSKGKNTGAAVVVFPGGGFNVLAIDLEGSEVCEWLASRGITGVLLKYRVPASGPHYDKKLHRHVEVKAFTALEDAQRTLGLVRFHAGTWHIDPHKVGVVGFSAGGHLVATTSTRFENRLYQPIDAADQESCRPDFAMALYPGHMLENTTNEFELNPKIPVSSNTPPTFIVQAENDNVDEIANSLTYYIALEKAGIPTEMHLYAKGKHAFGLRHTNKPITDWPRLAEKWLRTIGMISK